jgi:hypothetical protein
MRRDGMMAWVCKLPEVGDELIAKAKRVDALREEVTGPRKVVH